MVKFLKFLNPSAACNSSSQYQSLKNGDVNKFWLVKRIENPDLMYAALKMLTPFCTSCLCEVEFSLIVRLNLEKDRSYKVT